MLVIQDKLGTIEKKSLQKTAGYGNSDIKKKRKKTKEKEADARTNTWPGT